MSKRDDFVRTAIDGWNTELGYWDRRIKYGKMMTGAYTFYRGTAQLFWHDFAHDERLGQFGNERTITWLQGDAHAYNFGAFRNDMGELVYGLNDFDESITADYQLDLWRLAASLVLIARQNDNLSQRTLARVLEALACTYLETMQTFVDEPNAVKALPTIKTAYGKLDDFLEVVAADEGMQAMLDKWVPANEDGDRAFDLTEEKLGSVTRQERQAILDAMAGYWSTIDPEDDSLTMVQRDPSRAKVLDVARRLEAGTGSLGTTRYYLLLRDGEGKLHILDIKQQSRPSAYAFVSDATRADYDDHAQGNDAQVQAIAYRALSAHPDPWLGWMRIGESWFSVRERSPYKEAYPALLVDAKGVYKSCALKSRKSYTKLVQQWGAIMAANHAYAERVEAQAHGQPHVLAREIVALTKGREGTFVRLVRDIALEYADQVEADWKAFVAGLGADIVPVR